VWRRRVEQEGRAGVVEIAPTVEPFVLDKPGRRPLRQPDDATLPIGGEHRTGIDWTEAGAATPNLGQRQPMLYHDRIEGTARHEGWLTGFSQQVCLLCFRHKLSIVERT